MTRDRVLDEIIALRLEIDALIGQPRAGASWWIRNTDAAHRYRAFVGRVGRAVPLGSLGAITRAALTVFEALPLTTLPTDLVDQALCMDLLVDRAQAAPDDPLALVQLAEAVDLDRRLRVALHYVTALDPRTFLIDSVLNGLAGLGESSESSPVEDLVRRAHRAALRDDMRGTYRSHLALARAYQLAGLPGWSIHHGWQAYAAAGRQPVSTSQSAADLPDAVEIGAALTSLAWGYLSAGDADTSRALATRSVNLGFSCGHEVLAVLVDRREHLLDRRAHRLEFLDQVTTDDRRFWRGAWRSSGQSFQRALLEQIDKIPELVTGRN